MKKILIILSFLVFNSLYSQQVIKMCDDSDMVYTYSTESNVSGVINWIVDNTPFYSNDLTIDWSSYPLGIHQITAFQFNSDCPSDTVSYTVELIECPYSTMWAPNCFTPDGDENNNVWKPIGYNYFKEYFFIVNRWGEIIFESYDLDYGWDGTYKGVICQDGVYVYVLEWYDVNNRYRRVYGHVTLLK